VGQGLARQEREAAHVDGELPVEVVGVEEVGRPEREHARGVHEHVEAAGALDVRRDGRDAVRLARHVARHRRHAREVDRRRRSREAGDVEAVGREPLGDRAADAARGAADERARHAQRSPASRARATASARVVTSSLR
jgi:hypothetical protein